MNEAQDKLFEAADNHAEDTGEFDHAIGDLQDLLRSAWSIMTVAQRQAFLESDQADAVVEAGARDEFTTRDLTQMLSRAATSGSSGTAPASTKLVVLCRNSEGAPEFFKCELQTTEAQVQNGEHYALAENAAEDQGFEGPMLAFDRNDPARRQLEELASWF